MHSATHCYIGRREGEPGCYAACVDMADMLKETAKFISGIVKEGGIVEHVTIEESGRMLKEYILWRKTQKRPTR